MSLQSADKEKTDCRDRFLRQCTLLRFDADRAPVPDYHEPHPTKLMLAVEKAKVDATVDGLSANEDGIADYLPHEVHLALPQHARPDMHVAGELSKVDPTNPASVACYKDFHFVDDPSLHFVLPAAMLISKGLLLWRKRIAESQSLQHGFGVMKVLALL